MKTSFPNLIFISHFSTAQENGTLGKSNLIKNNSSSKSFEICTEFIDKNGIRSLLGQAWFASGDNPEEAKSLSNYSVDYNEKPFAHNFYFTNLPKQRLWLDCVYFACEDALCSSGNAGSDPEYVHHELKKRPVGCKTKVKMGNPTKIESFTCKYEDKNSSSPARH